VPINYPPLIQLDHQIGGNTAGATANISVGTYVLAGGNNITLSQNANTVTISAGAGGAGDGGNILAAGTRTAGSNSSVLFSNLNGLIWGLDAVNGSVMTASYTVPAQTAFVLSNSNGISFGTNGSTVTATVQTNYLTTAMASNRGSDFVQATAAFAGTNASGTIASGGISVSVNAGGAGDGGNILAAGTRTAGSNSSVLFSDANGVSWGLNAVAGSIMTASVKTDYLTTAMASNRGSDFVQATAAFAGTNASGTIASNGISVSVAAPGGGAGATVSKFYNMLGEPIAGTTSLTVGGSSVFVEPFIIPVHVSASYLRLPISAGFGSTTFASTANTTLSLNQSLTQFFCIYSQGVGASSRSIQSIYSSSVSLRLNVHYAIGAASGNQSCSHAITYPSTGNSSIAFSTSYAPAASSIGRISTTHLTAFTGALFMDVPYASLLTPGNYWLGIQSSTATANTGTALTAATSRGSYIAISQVSSNIREMGANTTEGSNMWWGYGHGWWTTNTFGATTASMALSQISTIANQPIVPFYLFRDA